MEVCLEDFIGGLVGIGVVVWLEFVEVEVQVEVDE
jgi:hypothetical protein